MPRPRPPRAEGRVTRATTTSATTRPDREVEFGFGDYDRELLERAQREADQRARELEEAIQRFYGQSPIEPPQPISHEVEAIWREGGSVRLNVAFDTNTSQWSIPDVVVQPPEPGSVSESHPEPQRLFHGYREELPDGSGFRVWNEGEQYWDYYDNEALEPRVRHGTETYHNGLYRRLAERYSNMPGITRPRSGVNTGLPQEPGMLSTIPGVINSQKCNFQLVASGDGGLSLRIASPRNTNRIRIIDLMANRGRDGNVGLVFLRRYLETHFAYGLKLVLREDVPVIQEVKPESDEMGLPF